MTIDFEFALFLSFVSSLWSKLPMSAPHSGQTLGCTLRVYLNEQVGFGQDLLIWNIFVAVIFLKIKYSIKRIKPITLLIRLECVVM